MAILFLIFLVLFARIVLDIPFYLILLAILGIVVLFSVIYALALHQEKRLVASIEKAELIKEMAVYKKKSEYSGCSVSWSDMRHHFKYVDVLDHYKYVFKVTYKDGSRGILQCKSGSTLYNELKAKQ